MLTIRGKNIPQFKDRLQLVFGGEPKKTMLVTITHLSTKEGYRNLSSDEWVKRRQRFIHTSTKYFDPENNDDDHDYYESFIVPIEMKFDTRDLGPDIFPTYIRIPIHDFEWSKEKHLWQRKPWWGSHPRLNGQPLPLHFSVDYRIRDNWDILD